MRDRETFCLSMHNVFVHIPTFGDAKAGLISKVLLGLISRLVGCFVVKTWG